MKNRNLLLLGLLISLVGCTANPPISQVPIEEHEVVIEPEPVEPTVIVSAVEDAAVPSSSNNIDSEDAEEPNQAIVPVSPSAIKSAPKNAAVVALLDSAKQQSQNGALRSAQTSLQRAQRIAPREPAVYYDLAKVHIALQDYGLAEQVALKGVSIVQGQSKQLHRFWNLIAEIRSAAGKKSGAAKAKEMADRYEGY
jgi:predicted Zn-dependent protease